MKDRDRCPTHIDEKAEAYCMGSLAAWQAVAFEDHYITCEICAAVVAETDVFVGAMKSAALAARGASPRVLAAG